ncbi:MAG: RluA family pseudouridine synthase [Faecousia sp.]
MTVFYEDGQLLVCHKPAGVLSAKDASGKPAMSDLLAPRMVYPVHRLDREVSGLMVFAKTPEAAAFLSARMQDGFSKEYLAVCEKAPQENEAELTDLLFHDRAKNKTYVVKRKRSGVKEAKLFYRVEARAANGRALLRIRLYTGRTHQIRVQLASRGCPLCGDKKYGAESGGALSLCSWRLSFPHPNGQQLCFTLPESLLPPWIAALR